jgi:hypothetical protein
MPQLYVIGGDTCSLHERALEWPLVCVAPHCACLFTVAGRGGPTRSCRRADVGTVVPPNVQNHDQ